MTNEPVDKFFGVPLSEWIARIPNELDVDAVGLWQIIPVGRDSFGLSDEALDDFVRRSIIALLDAGAVPVYASSDLNIFWAKQTHYGQSRDDIVNNVIEEWKISGVDPDQDGLWFAIIES